MDVCRNIEIYSKDPFSFHHFNQEPDYKLFPRTPQACYDELKSGRITYDEMVAIMPYTRWQEDWKMIRLRITAIKTAREKRLKMEAAMTRVAEYATKSLPPLGVAGDPLPQTNPAPIAPIGYPPFKASNGVESDTPITQKLPGKGVNPLLPHDPANPSWFNFLLHAMNHHGVQRLRYYGGIGWWAISDMKRVFIRNGNRKDVARVFYQWAQELYAWNGKKIHYGSVYPPGP
jgi:hypothetical protein